MGGGSCFENVICNDADDATRYHLEEVNRGNTVRAIFHIHHTVALMGADLKYSVLSAVVPVTRPSVSGLNKCSVEAKCIR